MDTGKDRLIYICDSDITASFCPPGDWDEMVFDDLLTFLFGDDVDPIEKLYGTSSMPAVITRTDQYGYRCTAGCYVMRVKQYPVLLFFDTDMGEVVRSGAIYLLQYVILLTAVAVAVELIFLCRIRKRVVNPIRQMTAAAHSYAIERQSDKRGGRHFSDLDVSTGDEIEELALTMKDMVYKEYELTLAPGDIIFQYSDGVTESTNVHDELFGTDRMLEALNRRLEDRPEELVETLNESIDEFVGKALQFDDITMLCLVYHGPVKSTEEQAEKGEPVQ